MMRGVAWLALLLLCLAGPAARAAEVQPDENGLYHTAWFLDSFLDLRDDHHEAVAAGKRLAVVFEQKGCHYCRDMHVKYLSDPAIAGWIKAHYAVVQLDLHGSRGVTDLDGEHLSEAEMARKHGIHTTPTILFIGKQAAEVTRMPGLLDRDSFLALFQYAYEEPPGDFPAWMAEHPKRP